MNQAKTVCRLVLLAFVFASSELSGQTPAPIVVQAASPAPAVTTTGPVQDPSSAQAPVKVLQEIKAVNQDILQKQKAALERLDELHKAAEQLKTYTKRG